MSDTVTLELQGTVSLSDFSTAVARFDALVAALTAESDGAGIAWQIDALEYGSAITTARGVSTNGAIPERIDRVVRAYLEVGQALESGGTVPFSPAVKQTADALVRLLSGGTIEAIRFETAADDAIVRQPPTLALPAAPAPRPRSASYGAVTGRIQTLTSRNALRFVVYDHIHDRAVSCYLVEGGQAMMREMWDRMATVEGWVSRDPASGRPLTVRRVSDVTPLPEREPDGYKRARGAIPRGSDEPLPEVMIRRLRDAV
jgi:hypothetical protein